MTKQKSILLSFILLMLPTAASAASVVWSQVSQEVFSMTVIKAVGAVSLIMNLEHPGVSVTYHANAYKLDSSGQRVGLLNANNSLPVGAKVLFTFPADSQFNYTDISWYATGSAFGTPYGQWVYGSGDARVGACSGQPYATGLSITHGTPGNTIDYTSAGLADEYALLSVAPPPRSIQVSGPVSCTDAPSGDKTCTLTGEGSVIATYSFAATQADFFGGMYYYFTRQDFIEPANGQQQGCRDFGLLEPAIIVPAQTIAYQIAVVRASDPPMNPTVTSTSCTVGTSLELAFASTDPDGHQLRYGVDWDDDGSVDQFVPPSGYVPSGSEQSAKRTFAVAGEKHVAVMVENDRGARSEWTHYSFQCAEAPEDNDTNDNDNNNPPSPQQCSIGYVYQDGACVFTSCPIGYVKQGTACVFQGCPVGYTLQNGVCVWSGCPEGFLQQGSQCVLENQCTSLPYCQGNDLFNGCTHERIQVCQYGCANGVCKGVPSPTAALSASPALVKRGQSTKLSWTSQNASACAVTGTNGDSWTGLSATNKPSSALNGITAFTLHCDALRGATPAFIEKNVTVTVRADWSEE